MNNTASEKPFNKQIHELPVIELKGSFRKMGLHYGESCRSQIHELYEIRLNAALKHAADRGRIFSSQQALAIAEENLDIVRNFDPDAHEELLGICEGAAITPAQLYIMQGLTDFRDFLSWGKTPDGLGCTSLIVSRERARDEQLLMAQNWDLSTSNMPYVCFVKRQPDSGPHTMSLTIAGGLSMIALNSEGLAIGTNNIKTTDTRRGVHYLNLIHKVMSCRTFSKGAKVITEAQRSGAHYFMLGDSHGNYGGFECSAKKVGFLTSCDGLITHCNHPLHEDIQPLNAEDMGQSTCNRQQRIDHLCQDKTFDIAVLKTLLSDHEGDDLAICRHDVSEGISTNATVIMSPETGEIHACRSHPHIGKWQSFSF